MKDFLFALGAYLMVAAIFYLLFSFINWDINAGNWGNISRVFYAIGAIIGFGEMVRDI